MLLVIAALLAYLLGSVPFAVIVSRLFKLADPRSYGSKNPGATNVLRSGNKLAAALTLLLDALKGSAAVLLAQMFADQLGGAAGIAVVMVAVFVGHLFPIFLRFRGGKGVATALGICFAVAWWLGLGVCAVWVVVALLFRYSSLASLCGTLFAPILFWFMVGQPEIMLALLVIAVGIFVRHAANIKKLVNGTESRIGKKARLAGP